MATEDVDMTGDSRPMSTRPPGAVLHSSSEPGELSQYLYHSTINIFLGIIIVIIGPPATRKLCKKRLQWVINRWQ